MQLTMHERLMSTASQDQPISKSSPVVHSFVALGFPVKAASPASCEWESRWLPRRTAQDVPLRSLPGLLWDSSLD